MSTAGTKLGHALAGMIRPHISGMAAQRVVVVAFTIWFDVFPETKLFLYAKGVIGKALNYVQEVVKSVPVGTQSRIFTTGPES